PPQDLRKARIHLLGLSRRTSRGAKSPRCPGAAPTHQAALRHRLTAPTFAPITKFPTQRNREFFRVTRNFCEETGNFGPTTRHRDLVINSGGGDRRAGTDSAPPIAT